MTRSCSGCVLCCKLLPIKEFEKPANCNCPHQRTGKGCAIYSRRPISCALWNCRWLVEDDTAELRRPDRTHYVIDLVPDFVTAENKETGKRLDVEVVQVWCDPDYPDAWRDPALLAYIERRGAEGKGALIRFSETRGMTVFPPTLSPDGQWHYWSSSSCTVEHTGAERHKHVNKARQRWDSGVNPLADWDRRSYIAGGDHDENDDHDERQTPTGP
jgi:hypothetical protein